MYNDDKLICIGQITSAHGIKGHVKVRSFTEPSIKIFSYKELIDDTQTPVALKLIGNSAMMVCAIEGVNSRNMAETLTGKKLYILRSELPLPHEDEFYINDIEGSTVYCIETKDKLGIITGIYNFGAGDLVEIAFENGEKSLLPFNKDIFAEMNMSEKKVFINLPKYSEII